MSLSGKMLTKSLIYAVTGKPLCFAHLSAIVRQAHLFLLFYAIEASSFTEKCIYYSFAIVSLLRFILLLLYLLYYFWVRSNRLFFLIYFVLDLFMLG
ncbi:hypothetical protein BVRB_5g119760 [Beta vulgaris subsp. vulgaris]|nr:hypothetical protein BVRB_5g119760 [Beta vulgaris subsp. vulgaris]